MPDSCSPRVGGLLYFPRRRICALGVADAALEAVRAAMPYVAVSTDGEALQHCDLLVLDSADRGAVDLVQWVRSRLPDFPVLLWAAPRPVAVLVEQCRRLLFPTDTSVA